MYVLFIMSLFRLATGGFDKSLRLWTLEGDPTFRIDDFQGGGLSSFTYIHKTRTLWVACGLSTPLIYDPKSGDNVSQNTHELPKASMLPVSSCTMFLLWRFIIFRPRVMGKENHYLRCVFFPNSVKSPLHYSI